MHTACALRPAGRRVVAVPVCVVGAPLQCHSEHARTGTMCRSVWTCRVAASLPAIQKLYRDIEPLPRALRACCCVYRGALLRRIVEHYCAVSQPLCVVSRLKGRPQPRYNICIATPPLARPRARAASRPCARPAVSCSMVAVSWPPWRTLSYPVSRYKSCIVT